MNRERAKELLPIIQAYAEGKTIQCRCGASDIFEDMNQCQWIDGHDYRIKPEPEVIYANKRKDRLVPVAYSNRIDALSSVPLLCPEKYEYIAKKFIEVINEE